MKYLFLLVGFATVCHAVEITEADRAAMALTGDDQPVFQVRAGTYQAEVYANGRVRVLAAGTELFRRIMLAQDHGREPLVTGNIHRTAPDTLTLRQGETLPEEDKSLPKLPGYALVFSNDTITIKAVDIPKQQPVQRGKDQKQPAALELDGVFGDGATAVTNLFFQGEDALPAAYLSSYHMFAFGGRYGHYWPDIGVTFTNGNVVEIHDIGGVGCYIPEGKEPPCMEAMQAPRGYWKRYELKTDMEVKLVIHAPVSAAARQPAPVTFCEPTKARGMFDENERCVFNLRVPKGYALPGEWTVAWTLEDHEQQPAGTGHTTIRIPDNPEFPLRLPVDITPATMGFFRAHVVISRPGSAARTHDFNFARCRFEHPELRELDGQRDVDGEFLWANILGERGYRGTPSLEEHWNKYFREETGKFDAAAYETALGNWLKINRTVRTFFFFTDAHGGPKSAAWLKTHYPDEAERQAAWSKIKRDYLETLVGTAAKFGIKNFEPINEPNLGMKPAAYVKDLLEFEYPIVKAVNPQANFLGGSICGLPIPGFMRQVYELGGGTNFNGLSFHPYTGLGFQEAYRAGLAEWWQLVREFHGDPAAGLWMTECCWHRGWGFGDYEYDKSCGRRQSQARNAALMLLNAEALGIPRDRLYIFYHVEHGYNDMYLMKRQEPFAAAVALQVLDENLRDARFEREFPLPGKGHYFQVYRDDTRTVAVVFTGSERHDIPVTTDAGSVELTDMLGNRQHVVPANGRLILPASGDPLYVVAAAGKHFEPDYDGLPVEPNLALATLGATASASSVYTTPDKKRKPTTFDVPVTAALSGDWSGYSSVSPFDGGRLGWRESETDYNQFPNWFEVKLPAPQPVASVRVYGDYGAWEHTLRDWDIQVFVAGDWKTVGQVRSNYNNWVHEHRFAPVTTDRVRVMIYDTNFAHNPKNIPGSNWTHRESCLRAIDVLGAAPGKAAAFFVRDLPRKHTKEAGATTELSYTIHNIEPHQLTARFRAIAPVGVKAEPAEQDVTVPAQSEITVRLTATLAANVTPGIYTVLGGLYRDGQLICPDYEARVLTVKPPVPPTSEKK